MWQRVYHSINSIIIPARFSLLMMSFIILLTLEHRFILTYIWHVCLCLLLRHRATQDNVAGHHFRAGFTFACSRHTRTEKLLAQILPSLFYWFPGRLGRLACFPAPLAGGGGDPPWGARSRMQELRGLPAPAVHPPCLSAQTAGRELPRAAGDAGGQACSPSPGSWAAAGGAARQAGLALAAAAA